MTVEYSTISYNTVFGDASDGGGIYASGTGDGSIYVSDSTIFENFVVDSEGRGGGISMQGFDTQLIDLQYSIVAGSTVGNRGRDLNMHGGASQRTNVHESLIGNVQGNAVTVLVSGNPDLIGTDQRPVDPMLRPLADNGGPTMTHAFYHGSPAIDAGRLAILAGGTDQRVFDRFVDGDGDARAQSDLGAYEQQFVTRSGDLNGDGRYDCADIDQIVDAIAKWAGMSRPWILMVQVRLTKQDVDAWLSQASRANPLVSQFVRGDANLDGVVDELDLNMIALHWQSKDAQVGWCGGDFDGDGIVGPSDLNQVSLNWRQDFRTPVTMARSSVDLDGLAGKLGE